VSDRLDEIEARLAELGAPRTPDDGAAPPAENVVSDTEKQVSDTEQEAAA
jgi:hypothetical protein